jgi:hypothetical protein
MSVRCTSIPWDAYPPVCLVAARSNRWQQQGLHTKLTFLSIKLTFLSRKLTFLSQMHLTEKCLRNVSLILRNVSLILRNVSLILRNVSLILRNDSLILRNVSLILRAASYVHLRSPSLQRPPALPVPPPDTDTPPCKIRTVYVCTACLLTQGGVCVCVCVYHRAIHIYIQCFLPGEATIYIICHMSIYVSCTLYVSHRGRISSQN